jgi:hypothetical protein
MRLQHPQRLRSLGTDFVAPARLCIEPRGNAGKPVHVIIGISATGKVAMAAELVGEWLAGRFGQRFVENRTEAESSLAVEAFYDELDYHCGGGAFIAAIGLVRNNGSGGARRACGERAEEAELSEFVSEAEPITLKFQGLAHAFFNRKTGRAQVTFDHLPGALAFVRRRSSTQSGPSGALPRREEASAWYGFGTASHADIRRGLSNAISHGIVDAELKTRLAAYV